MKFQTEKKKPVINELEVLTDIIHVWKKYQDKGQNPVEIQRALIKQCERVSFVDGLEQICDRSLKNNPVLMADHFLKSKPSFFGMPEV